MGEGGGSRPRPNVKKGGIGPGRPNEKVSEESQASADKPLQTESAAVQQSEGAAKGPN